MSDTEGIGAKDSARFVSEVWPFAEVLARGARRLTRNDDDAQDLLQDTLLHAYTGFHTFRTGSNLQAWLFRIMHNRSTDNYRRQQRRPPELLAGAISDQDLTEQRARESVGARSAESVLIDALPDNSIRAAMLALSPGSRLVLYYVVIEGHTCAETATLMGIPVGTVMSRVSRARRQLRSMLAEKDFTPTDLVA